MDTTTPEQISEAATVAALIVRALPAVTIYDFDHRPSRLDLAVREAAIEVQSAKNEYGIERVLPVIDDIFDRMMFARYPETDTCFHILKDLSIAAAFVAEASLDATPPVAPSTHTYVPEVTAPTHFALPAVA